MMPLFNPPDFMSIGEQIAYDLSSLGRDAPLNIFYRIGFEE